ncbi:MAG: PTS sugar transporter subunit IIB [Brevinema sp.]
MHIVTVCGFGIGSSLILKMSVEQVLKELAIDHITVECSDLMSAPSLSANIYFTSQLIAKELGTLVSQPVLSISSFIDKEEIKRTIQRVVEN